MESFWDKALPVINNMIVDLSPFSYSVKRGVGVVDIRLEIQPEPNFTPPNKKKKPSPSRLRRNHRRLLLFLEKNKAFPPAEPVNSGIIEVEAGTSQVCAGVSLIPGIQHGGPDIPAIELREIANIQENDDHTGEGDNSSEAISSEGEGDDSSEVNSSVEGVDNPDEEDEDDGRYCNNCYEDIIEIIYRCNICDDGEFDLCNICYKREGHIHPMEIIHPDSMSGDEGEEDLAPGSPDVESSTLTAMKVDNIDINVSDVFLHGTPSVKVSPKLVEELAKTRQFVKVTRKGRRKKNDPNNCKAS